MMEQEDTVPQKEKPSHNKPKILVFISGSGTNLEKIINQVEAGNITAEIIGVLSNKPDAYGLTRARNHNIPSAKLPSQGQLKDSQLRKEYEQKIIDYVKDNQPHLIVLAGWMVVLGDEFLRQMQALKVIVINLHPALLTPGNEATIQTSQGEIPVFRGTDAIKQAYEAEIPLSGVTVHQILPDHAFDTGPVITQKEVSKIPGEGLEAWEARIHKAEYQVLPTAINQVLAALNQGIDPSDGSYPWQASED